MALSQVLFVYNTSIARSLTDARAYIARRGLNVNLVGVNFGSTGDSVTRVQLFDGTYDVQHFEWLGAVISTYDGLPIGEFINDVIANAEMPYQIDGLITSTCVPYRTELGEDDLTVPLEGWLAAGNGIGPTVPFGKLGCNPAQNNSVGNDMLTSDGVTYCWDKASASALLAEAANNFDKLHIIGSNVVDGTRGFNPTWVANTFTPTAVDGGVTWTAIQAGTTQALATPNGWNFDPWKSPSNTPGYVAQDIFCWNAPSANTNSTDEGSGGGGTFSWSNSYTVSKGGFCFPWYSNPQRLRMDFLWHGGSAAFGCVNEPLDIGLIDPNYLQMYLLQGYSCMEARFLAATQHKPFPNYAFGPVSDPARWRNTVYGDPLFTPYKQTQPTISAPRPFQ